MQRIEIKEIERNRVHKGWIYAEPLQWLGMLIT